MHNYKIKFISIEIIFYYPKFCLTIVYILLIHFFISVSMMSLHPDICSGGNFEFNRLLDII